MAMQALRHPPSDVETLDEYGLLEDCEVRRLSISNGNLSEISLVESAQYSKLNFSSRVAS